MKLIFCHNLLCFYVVTGENLIKTFISIIGLLKILIFARTESEDFCCANRCIQIELRYTYATKVGDCDKHYA